MTPLRIGVIGCGRIARAVHLPVLGRLPSARVVALAEPDESGRRAASAIARGATAYADYADLLRAGGVDAAVICVPSHLHVPVATAAFDAGLHVYLEKPIALSVAEGERLVEAWRRARKVGMIGFNFRFHPQVVRIRERLGDGAIGTPLGVRAIFSILPHELPEWKRTRGSGGGVLLDLASHHIDLVHYLFADDPVVRVFASVRSLSGEGDHAAVQLELASGLMVQLFVSLGTVDEHRIEIVGTTGKLVMDRTELVRPDHVPATQQGARARRLARALAALEPARVLRSPGMEPSFDAALGAFVSRASAGAFEGPDSSHGLRSSPDLHGLRSSPDLIDGLRSLAVVEAAERSAASGAAESVAWPPSLPTPRPLATSAGR